MLQQVKILAARRGTSISGLLTALLADEVQREDEYSAAQHRALEQLAQGFDFGTGGIASSSRDDLHER